MSKPHARISVIEDLGHRLLGFVYNHPDYEDGDRVYTSRILLRGDNEVETLHTIYEILPEESLPCPPRRTGSSEIIPEESLP